MQREFKDWEKDFIYLSYPTFKTNEISNILGCANATIYGYGQKLKLKKFQLYLKIGQRYGDLETISIEPNRKGNKTCYLCKCKCGKELRRSVQELFFHYNVYCRCRDALPFDEEKIAKDYENGKTFRQISYLYRTSSSKIKQILKKFNIPVRSKNYYSKLGRCANHTGYKEIQGTLWGNFKRGASTRGLEFSITIEYAYSILQKQNFLCALTDEKLYPDKRNQRNSGNMSLDRIDSSKGYVEGNIQWITKDMNLLKREKTNEEIINLCKKVANKFKDAKFQ